jgi:hypothetical protein
MLMLTLRTVQSGMRERRGIERLCPGKGEARGTADG